jgi:hypothetical protein
MIKNFRTLVTALVENGYTARMDADNNLTVESTRLEFEEINMYFGINETPTIIATLKNRTVVDLKTKSLMIHQQRIKTDYGR